MQILLLVRFDDVEEYEKVRSVFNEIQYATEAKLSEWQDIPESMIPYRVRQVIEQEARTEKLLSLDKPELYRILHHHLHAWKIPLTAIQDINVGLISLEILLEL